MSISAIIVFTLIVCRVQALIVTKNENRPIPSQNQPTYHDLSGENTLVDPSHQEYIKKTAENSIKGDRNDLLLSPGKITSFTFPYHGPSFSALSSAFRHSSGTKGGGHGGGGEHGGGIGHGSSGGHGEGGGYGSSGGHGSSGGYGGGDGKGGTFGHGNGGGHGGGGGHGSGGAHGIGGGHGGGSYFPSFGYGSGGSSFFGHGGGTSSFGGYGGGGHGGGGHSGGGYDGGGSGGGGHGSDGGFNSLTPEIHKSVYVHVAPPEEDYVPQQKVIMPKVSPRKNYQIIFIKAPSPPAPAAPIIPPFPPQSDKTLIYVLHPKAEEAPPIHIPEPPQNSPSKPEVYFIRYKTNTETVSLDEGDEGGGYGGYHRRYGREEESEKLEAMDSTIPPSQLEFEVPPDQNDDQSDSSGESSNLFRIYSTERGLNAH